jgi:hypothetical protein
LHMNGDVSAEQNHSGVVACLGMGAACAIAEQMTHLLGRQKNVDKTRRQKEDDQHVTASRCSSTCWEPTFASPQSHCRVHKRRSGPGRTQR